MDLAVRALCGSLSIGDQPTNSSVLDMNGTSNMCTLAYQTCTDKLKPRSLFGLVVEVCRNSSGSVWPSRLHRFHTLQAPVTKLTWVALMPSVSHVWDEKQSHLSLSTVSRLEPRALSWSRSSRPSPLHRFAPSRSRFPQLTVAASSRT